MDDPTDFEFRIYRELDHRLHMLPDLELEENETIFDLAKRDTLLEERTIDYIANKYNLRLEDVKSIYIKIFSYNLKKGETGQESLKPTLGKIIHPSKLKDVVLNYNTQRAVISFIAAEMRNEKLTVENMQSKIVELVYFLINKYQEFTSIVVAVFYPMVTRQGKKHVIKTIQVDVDVKTAIEMDKKKLSAKEFLRCFKSYYHLAIRKYR